MLFFMFSLALVRAFFAVPLELQPIPGIKAPAVEIPSLTQRDLKDGGRYRIRTYDFHRVNFEFNELKPFACFAFPPPMGLQNRQKPPSFGDELVTSFCARAERQYFWFALPIVG